MPENEVNPQATPAPSSAGQPDVNSEVTKLRDENARLQREAQGFKSEMLSEREKRQVLERSRNATAETNGGTVLHSQPGAADQENPLLTVVKPLFDRVTQMEAQSEERRALSWFARRENITVEDPEDVEAIKAAPAFKELTDVIAEHGLQNMPMRTGIKTAHELLTKKRDAVTKAKADKAAAEATERATQAAAQQTAPAVGMPAAGSKLIRVSRQDIGKMSTQEYSAMKDKAAKAGETILVE